MTYDEMEQLCAGFNAHAHDTYTFWQDIDDHLKFADRELGTYGIEAVTLDGDVRPVLLYCNNGHTYRPTIVYNVPDDLFYVSSWGDALEEMETRRTNGEI